VVQLRVLSITAHHLLSFPETVTEHRGERKRVSSRQVDAYSLDSVLVTDDHAPTAISTRGQRAALVLAVAGVVTVLGSQGVWAECGTVRCDSPLMALDSMSGIEFGYGVVTGIAGVLLILIGLDARRNHGISGLATSAIEIALLVLGTVSTFVLSMYRFADGFVPILWPPGFGADGFIPSIAASDD